MARLVCKEQSTGTTSCVFTRTGKAPVTSWSMEHYQDPLEINYWDYLRPVVYIPTMGHYRGKFVTNDPIGQYRAPFLFWLAEHRLMFRCMSSSISFLERPDKYTMEVGWREQGEPFNVPAHVNHEVLAQFELDDNDNSKLIYADWLEDEGCLERANMVRGKSQQKVLNHPTISVIV